MKQKQNPKAERMQERARNDANVHYLVERIRLMEQQSRAVGQYIETLGAWMQDRKLADDFTKWIAEKQVAAVAQQQLATEEARKKRIEALEREKPEDKPVVPTEAKNPAPAQDPKQGAQPC